MAVSWRWWLVVPVVIVGLLLAACGDDGDEPSAPSPADEGVETAEPAEGETTEAPEAPSDDVINEIRSLSQEWGGKSAKITYDLSGTGTDEGSMTLYWRTPDWRVDMAIAGQGDITIIVAADESYLCATEGGEGSCLSFPIDEELPVPFLSLFQDPGALADLVEDEVGGLDIDRSERTIAGEDATCFSASGTIEGEEGESEWCFSDDGVLLLIASSSAASGTFRLEASDVSSDVSDDDFEPPYPVMELPSP